MGLWNCTKTKLIKNKQTVEEECSGVVVDFIAGGSGLNFRWVTICFSMLFSKTLNPTCFSQPRSINTGVPVRTGEVAVMDQHPIKGSNTPSHLMHFHLSLSKTLHPACFSQPRIINVYVQIPLIISTNQSLLKFL
jgi:hypothetical protein